MLTLKLSKTDHPTRKASCKAARYRISSVFFFFPHFTSLYPEVCLNIFFPFLVVHKVIAHLTIRGVLDVMRE